MQIHRGAAGGSFGLEEVGKTSQDEDTAHRRLSNNFAGQGDLAKPSDRGAPSQGLSQFCLSPGTGGQGAALGCSLGAQPGARALIQGSTYGFRYVLN